MTKDEALKLALEGLEQQKPPADHPKEWNSEYWTAIVAIREALAQPVQEPVAWLVTGENINALQVASIQRVIDRLKHAHHTDLCLRINGQDERFEADWIKHLQRATSPPQRQPLTDQQLETMAEKYVTNCYFDTLKFARAIEAAHGIGAKP